MTTTDIRGGRHDEGKAQFIESEIKRLRAGGPDLLLQEIKRTGVPADPNIDPEPALRRRVAEALYALQSVDGPDEETGDASEAASGMQRALFAGAAFASLDSGAMSVVEGSEDGMVIPLSAANTNSARFILTYVLPAALERWLVKNADYGDNHRTSKYGLKGELIGLDRKMMKLYRAIWLEEKMNGEGPEEMLEDLLGQVLIMLDLLARKSWE
jgi:hypothetical protein